MTTRADRILLVLPNLERGGGQRVLLQLVQSFLAEGREVHMVALLGGGPLCSDLPDAAALHELVSPDHATTGFALACRAFPKLLSLLRTIKPHAVLSTMTGTNLLTIVACMLAHGRARLVLREASSILNTRSTLKRQAMRWLYGRSNAIVAVSNGVAEDLRELGVPNERIRVIRNPVDQERLRSLARVGPTVPGIGGAPYIVALGRLTEAKDYPTLLRAYAASKLRHSHRLVIVGEGEQRGILENLVHELGIAEYVLLPGALDNPFRVLAGAALLVLSSRWEGYPNVLLEALALDVPVVSTDCQHGPRELLDYGRHGRLAPVGDPASFARAMDATLQESSSHSPTILEFHSPQIVASHYLVVLDGACTVSCHG